MTRFRYVHLPGNSHHLFQWFGEPETTLVAAELWMTLAPHSQEISLRRPDLTIAFEVDPSLYYEQNGFVVSDQGKPPDFVLEVASPSTADIDVGPKRDDYAALGVAEYWRFDHTGEHHGQRLAGDQLVDGRYRPFPIRELAGRLARRLQPRTQAQPALGRRPARLVRPGHRPSHPDLRTAARPGRPGRTAGSTSRSPHP